MTYEIDVCNNRVDGYSDFDIQGSRNRCTNLSPVRVSGYPTLKLSYVIQEVELGHRAIEL